jgi:hypothetical protein
MKPVSGVRIRLAEPANQCRFISNRDEIWRISDKDKKKLSCLLGHKGSRPVNIRNRIQNDGASKMSHGDWWSGQLITPGQGRNDFLKRILAFAAGVSLTAAILYAEVTLKQNNLIGIDDVSAEFIVP